MPLFSLECYASTEDSNGNVHWPSIDITSRIEKLHVDQYTAKIKSCKGFKDERDGALVRATFTHSQRHNAGSWAQMQVKKARMIEEFTALFCEAVPEAKKIKVQVPQIASVESGSVLHRKRTKDEVFIFEDKMKTSHFKVFIMVCDESKRESILNNQIFASISGMVQNTKNQIHFKQNETKYIKNNLWQKENNTEDLGKSDKAMYKSLSLTSSGVEYQTTPYTNNLYPILAPSEQNSRDLKKVPFKTLHALMHHFFNNRGGQMIIDCLQGTYSETSGYTLSQPNIHSVGEEFGPSDHGRNGILKVIQNHVCNEHCASLPSMTTLFLQCCI